jgi:hypothetical protein
MGFASFGNVCFALSNQGTSLSRKLKPQVIIFFALRPQTGHSIVRGHSEILNVSSVTF